MLAQQLGVAQDHDKEVVEVVGDPARETTDGLEALATMELCLHTLALADHPPLHLEHVDQTVRLQPEVRG